MVVKVFAARVKVRSSPLVISRWWALISTVLISLNLSSCTKVNGVHDRQGDLPVHIAAIACIGRPGVASDMTAMNSKLHRYIVIWDNWPLGVEALSGRSADLPMTVSASLSNPILSQDNRHPISDTWS